MNTYTHKLIDATRARLFRAEHKRPAPKGFRVFKRMGHRPAKYVVTFTIVGTGDEHIKREIFHFCTLRGAKAFAATHGAHVSGLVVGVTLAPV